MKYLLGIILIIFGIYLFWRCESGELPDIEDVKTEIWEDVETEIWEKEKGEK